MKRYYTLILALLLTFAGVYGARAQNEASSRGSAGGEDAVTVLTLNIWHDQEDWPARLNLIVEELERLRPDVILMQEVLQNENLPNQAATLAYRLGYDDVHFTSVDPAGAAKRYGNAILSRHPILETGDRKLEPLNDYRTAAYARIDVDGRPLSVYSTHLHYSGNSPGTDVRRIQIEDLLDFIERTRGGAPVIIGGDFNAVPDAAEMGLVSARYSDVFAAVRKRGDGMPGTAASERRGGGTQGEAATERPGDGTPREATTQRPGDGTPREAATEQPGTGTPREAATQRPGDGMPGIADALPPALTTTLNPAKGHSPRRIDYVYAGPELDPLTADIVLDDAGPDSVWASDHFGVLATLGFETQDFVDDLQERTFRWFWDETPPINGLTPDRAPSRPFSSIAAVGFALPTYAVGAERGYISREDAAIRTLNTLKFFWNAPQDTARSGISGYRGFFYHFLDMETGERFQTTELSTIDTALLMAGVVFAGEYFGRDNERERQIRSYADSLFRRVEWDWFQREDGLITMAWRPERGFGPAAYQGYDEAMILYLLALGSPTHPIDPKAWDTFTSTYKWADFYGYEHVNFAPLFGHQYSHMFVDYRGIYDEYMLAKGIDYFENSRRATYSQLEYGKDNPNGFKDYSGDIWGWTASDGPANTWGVVNGDSVRFHTYWARGVAAGDVRDDGTIVPTAAGGSIPFAPEITIPALKNIRDHYGDLVYNEYGFVDAFNPTYRLEFGDPQRGPVDPVHGWFDGDQLGIDQGPIVVMLENYRSGLVWDVMRNSDIIVRGLCRAGFTEGWLEGRCN